MTEGLFGVFRQAFPADGSGLFTETADGRTMTYAEMEALSGRFARLLQSLGLCKGDRLLSQIDNSPETICLYLACLRAGVIYTPTNPAYQRRELAHIFADSGPRLAVCRPDCMKRICEVGRGVPVLTLDQRGGGSLVEESAALDSDFGSQPIESDDVAAILYTSGSTGRPKGAMLTHGLLGWKAKLLTETWEWRADDILLHVMPLCHTHGLFMSLNCVLTAGARLLMLPRFRTEEVVSHLPRVTVFTGVPTMYARLLTNPDFGRDACRGLRLFISGSAHLPTQTFEAFHERTGHEIVECWGMTETLANASNPVAGKRRPGTVGSALPGIELRVVDREGRPQTNSEVGMIEVRGMERFAGYWRDPEATREALRPDGFFVTGDLGRFDDEGRLAIAGRAKDVVITGGYNVYPREVEAALQEIFGIGEAAVFGVPHADFGEGVTAAVEPDPENRPPEEASILESLKSQLANYKVPKRILVLETLPRSASGKVQKGKLRKRYEHLYCKPSD